MYEIKAEGGSNCIVYHNHLFLLFSEGDSENSMPLVAEVRIEPNISIVSSLEINPMVMGPAHVEGMMLDVPTCLSGLWVAQTPNMDGPVDSRISNSIVGHVG